MVIRRVMQAGWLDLLLPASRGHSLYLSGTGRYTGFIFLMSFLLVFLSACSNPSRATPPAATPIVPRPQPTPDPAVTQKAIALHLIAGMCLDPKLGQLLLVVYSDTNYA